MSQSFTGGDLLGTVDMAIYGAFGYLIYCAFKYRKWYRTERVKVVVLLSGHVAAVLTFGLINETRVWLALLPLLLVSDAVDWFSDTPSDSIVEGEDNDQKL